jgi:hypothetical protein
LFLFGTRGMRRIIEGPVVAVHLTGKHGHAWSALPQTVMTVST